MARPTVYGKEIRVNSQNECIGINLGYNFYCEHEGDTDCIVDDFNRHNSVPIDMNSLRQYYKEVNRIKKQTKQGERIISRWRLTPFNGHVFIPSVNTMLKMIVINNEEVRRKYSTVLLDDGHYYLLSIGRGLTPEIWEKKFGSKKTVSESDIFYMPDYQGLYRNTGFILNNGQQMIQGRNFGASWALCSSYMMIVLPAEQKSYLEDIQLALKAGNLACVQSEPRMFKDRGCCLINLEKAYLGGR